ncbi:MAG: peroxidase-related enzyme [Pseudonocardiales bacterium]
MTGSEIGGWFPVPAEEDLPEDLRKLFGKARANLGFVPNVLRTYSYRPERLRTWFAHFKALHVPTDHLDAADREMIAVVVSMANGCLYCLVAHGAALREALGDPVLGDRITLDWRRAGLDARRTAICEYAEKLTRDARGMTEDDLAALRAQGLAEEECWDVAEVASMYNFTNRMAMATNMLPNEEYHALARRAGARTP